MRRNTSQDDVGWPLTNDVAHCISNDNVVVLVTVKIEILFHSRNEGVGDVGCVDPLDQHSERSKGKQRGIKLEKKLPFFPSNVGRIPQPSTPAVRGRGGSD